MFVSLLGDAERGREFDRQYDAWDMRRKQLFEELEVLKFQQTLNDVKTRRLTLLHLAVSESCGNCQA